MRSSHTISLGGEMEQTPMTPSCGHNWFSLNKEIHRVVEELEDG